MILARFQNPFAAPPGCGTCDDARQVNAHDYSALPCPVCGCRCPKRAKGEPPPTPCPGCTKSRDLKLAAFHRFHRDPTVLEIDFSPEEYAAFRQMRAAHPAASRLTVLGWMEGQRYAPAKDPVFLAECEAALDDWRQATGRETKREAA